MNACSSTPFLKRPTAWMAAPLLWIAGVVVLSVIGLTATPDWIANHFDQDGASPVEAATIALFWLQIAFFWLVPPMRPGRWRAFWLTNFSLLTFFAICRQLDWHRLLVTPSGLPGATRGTPFKMKFLLNVRNPLPDRILVALCFVLVFALCGGTLLYFLPRLLRGLFRMHPVCWTIGFFGGTLILIQIFDRMSSVLRKDFGIHLTDRQHALTTALEEGLELLLPLFIILAVLQAHFIYLDSDAESGPLARHRAL
ncbi:MAG TPA: hypothetical protein PLJ32_04295 [Kiritimatiellia bacterium]|nr:hypothetical protein [Kiritimatiellia bacterium]